VVKVAAIEPSLGMRDGIISRVNNLPGEHFKRKTIFAIRTVISSSRLAKWGEPIDCNASVDQGLWVASGRGRWVALLRGENRRSRGIMPLS